MTDRTMTESQALARVEKLIHETAAVIVPKPRLELMPHTVAPHPCLHDDKSQDQIVVNRAYWLRDIPKSDIMNVSRQVRAYWESQGHRITASGREGNPDLSGVSQADGFTLALTWSAGDTLYLAATSACVWPKGTPEAK
ncbi:hypothetical protein ACIBHX_17785 [Nonomuraea sp. NPDC050536]|uniref:hypothetical protein n=1 Tax=Nonomuraea sp. NPDC050536 TaxID=3364366 RepID=UPI0037CC6001